MAEGMRRTRRDLAKSVVAPEGRRASIGGALNDERSSFLILGHTAASVEDELHKNTKESIAKLREIAGKGELRFSFFSRTAE